MKLENLNNRVVRQEKPHATAVRNMKRDELRIYVREVEAKLEAYENDYTIVITEEMQEVLSVEDKAALATLVNRANAVLATRSRTKHNNYKPRLLGG